ncbi:hypothetical protein Noda2021_09140 [Candidatus Dependentiae bacterium Noda2021]|nr:hypothetical protein Noda2021_09140 [Candidatus Dependentiae bacterium Noda2021]
MNIVLFLIFFTALATLYFVLGLRASRTVKTASDYYLAGRSLGVMQVTCNLIATQLGGGLLLGTAATAYSIGYYGILYTLGMSIGFLLLAMGIASRLQQFKVTTTAQLFETQYKSPALKKIASLLSIITFFGILIAQVIGTRSLIAGLGFDSFWLIIPFWFSVIGYTMLGGLRAITINDMIQLGLITLIFGSIFVYSLFSNPGLALRMWTEQSLVFAKQPEQTSLLSIILMPALFSLFQQDLAQRFFASRTKAVATVSALYAGLFLVLFACIPVYFGMATRLLDFDLQGANPLIVYLNNSISGSVVALALCAIVAAIVSTADALLNGISANITQDFNITLPGMSPLLRQKLRRLPLVFLR